MFSPEYRIVRDRWAGYEVQIRRWWWPFWVMPECNTHRTRELTEAFAVGHARGYVKYLGRFNGGAE